ncbi:translocation/assembly module TamB domain-containing protein [Lentilitoribacter sp. EG35]|uniref:translocation/assembly module TamB domain-containing protein n=1 Tax=Lentilitoribacter sp. EG35 TaxID=3234192 RepID=UPI00345F3A60
MIKKAIISFIGMLATLVVGVLVVYSQDNERSALIKYVEEQISSPSYQIKLNGLDGALSSDVSLDSITISDADGIWLEISKPKLVWTRSALLRGRLVVDTLKAEKINILRKPLPEEGLPAPESGSFAIPELPVAVLLEDLDLPLVEFGPDVIDLASKVSIAGKMILDEGSFDLDLEINRLDEIGGELKAIARYEGKAKTLFLDVDLSEPENGIIASLMNIPQKPPLKLKIAGNAPLSELEVVLAFDVANERILDGNANFANVQDGLHVSANLNGPLSKVLPENQRAFFGEQSELKAKFAFLNDGGFRLLNSNLNSGAVKLLASANMTSDGFLNALKLQGKLGSSSGERLQLPDDTNKSTIQSATLDINYDATSQNIWNGKLNLIDYASKDVSIKNVMVDAFGTILTENETKTREISFDVDGLASEIASPDQGLAEAIGRSIKLQFDGDWQSNSPVKISRFNILGETYKLLASGAFFDNTFNGNVTVEADDLNSFSSVTETNLNGSVKLAVNGDVLPFSRGFNLTIDGRGEDLKSGSDQVDQLLQGVTELTGKVARGKDGLVVDGLSLKNRQTNVTINGNLSSEVADLSAQAKIIDINVLDKDSSGQAALDIDLLGEQSPFNLNVVLGLPDGRLAKQNVSDLALIFEGQTNGSDLKGQLSSRGTLAKHAVSISGHLELDEIAVRLDDFIAQVGQSHIKGRFARNKATGLMQSDLAIKSQDISAIAAFGLIEASGSIDGKFTLNAANNNTQSASGEFGAAAFRVDALEIASANINFKAQDLLNQPKVDAVVSALGIVVGGIEAKNLSARIDNEGSLTKFELVSELARNSAHVNTSGSVNQVGDLTEVLIDELELKSNIANAALASQSRITLQSKSIQIEPTKLNVGGGFIEVKGIANEQVNIDIIAQSLPLNIANALQATLGADGIVGASAKISGSSDNLKIAFNANGQGVTTRQMRSFGLSPLSFSGDGGFANNVVSLTSFRIQNKQALAINANGKIPLSDSGLDINLDGTAPLEIADIFLIDRGTQLGGIAQLSAKVSGSLNNPDASGQVSLEGGTIVDPLSNLRINGVRVGLKLDKSKSADVTFSGNFASGGSVSASGRVGLTGQLPANLNIQMRSAKYSDGETFDTSVNGDLVINGDLLATPLLSGNLNLGHTEIVVPESFASEINLVDIEHINADKKVQKTLDRIKAVTPQKDTGNQGASIRLQLNINAPNQIFVRGRGLDAELGGSLGLSGSLDNIVPLGSFTLRRGRLSLLGQRLDLQSGTITLAGDLDPLLNFVATTQAGDTLASIQLRGTASDLKVTFSSSPELPEDEVLAKIIFGRNLTDLSPAQIVKLASVASELTGGNSPSLVDGLRKSTGLDDVDIVQDDQGNAAVKAGKYISDNVYLGVQAGKETEATINLDITDSLTARGSVGSDGKSSLGIFFEKDY